MKIIAQVKRGKYAGTSLHPHRHNDGAYVVSLTRFEKDYVRVENLEAVAAYVKKGFSVRMSNVAEGIHATSLIASSSISLIS